MSALDPEITPEVWSWVQANYSRPTTDKSFYTFAALVETRHRAKLASSQAEIERLTEVLYRAQEALGEYACHVGDKHPCIRTADQCRNECGKIAGDAALLIDAALSGSKD
jgi:hypothetical protein